MARWTALKLVWLPRGILRYMVPIIMIYFLLFAKIALGRLHLSMTAMCSWYLYQLDIKNVFLHGDLAEEVYMEQSLGFVAQGESGLVYRLCRSLYGLIIYVDVIVITGNDQDDIQKLK